MKILFELSEYLESLSDEQLISATMEAHADLQQASHESPNSERHQECFAGFVICADEMQARGIHTITLH